MTKKKRARSPEEKKEQFKKIITVGRKLFLEVGSEGFSMRALAKKLGMSPSNLYNYVGSKRELWFATIQEDFEVFTTKMKDLVEDHKGTQVELLIAIAEFYFDFAYEDFSRYQMMFMTPAPDSETIGPIEEKYNPKSFEIMVSVVKKAIKQGEIDHLNPMLFALFLWGIVHGNVELRVPEAFFPKQFIITMGDLSTQKVFVMKQIRNIMSYYKKEQN
jgi:AcrR family transcriptional regulator